MSAQALFTNSVIYGSLRLPQLTGMLTHDQIRDELLRQLEAKKITGAEVARKLGIAPARVTEIKKDERRIQQDEMPILAEMLGLSDTSAPPVQPIVSLNEVPFLGGVAQGTWLEQSMIVEDQSERKTIAYDRMAGDPSAEDLFAVKPKGTSMNLAFPDPRTILICRRIPFANGDFKPGDYVIAERTAHDLMEYTCKRVEMDDDGFYWLHSESDDPRWQEPWRIGKPDEDFHSDQQVSVIGKVVRIVIDFERTIN